MELNVENHLKDVIQCPICLENFNLSTKVPRQLHCQHNICKICLKMLEIKSTGILSKRKSHIECPVCRSKTFFRTLKDIKKSLILTQLMGSIKTDDKGSNQSRQSNAKQEAEGETEYENDFEENEDEYNSENTISELNYNLSELGREENASYHASELNYNFSDDDDHDVDNENLINSVLGDSSEEDYDFSDEELGRNNDEEIRDEDYEFSDQDIEDFFVFNHKY